MTTTETKTRRAAAGAPPQSRNAETTPTSGRFRRWLIAASLALGVSGCAIATPFRAADDASSQVYTGAVVVAITEAQLGDDRAGRRAFWRHVDLVTATLREQPGFIGVSLRREILGDTTWTMTVWRDEESLDAFVRSDTHQEAIAAAFGALAGARFVRFEVNGGDLPVDWDAALERLETDGRGY